VSGVARIEISNRPGPDGGASVECGPAISLLTAMLREGVAVRHDCGGKALCGTCRVRVLEGGAGLSPVLPREAARLAAVGAGTGMRLACQAHASRDLRIEVALPAGGG
jgi:adenylate cyclase